MRVVKGVFDATHAPNYSYMDGKPCVAIIGAEWALYLTEDQGSYQSFYDTHPESKKAPMRDGFEEMVPARLLQEREELKDPIHPFSIAGLLGQQMKSLNVEFQ